MKVTMIIRDMNGKEVERYTVPDGSWIQTETIGAQHVPAVTDPSAYQFHGYSVYLIPENPPKIPEEIRKILDGTDPRWGKNGWEWMGSNRAKAGGSTLNRAREMFALPKREFPVKLTHDACIAVMQDEKYCRELLDEIVVPRAMRDTDEALIQRYSELAGTPSATPGKVGTPPNEGIFRCRFCGAPYAYRENLELHEKGCPRRR